MHSTNRNLTLEDIAKIAGVSRSTVSRVVNNHLNVRDEVRSKVLDIIKQTGYTPHAVARSLASNRTNVIGLVIPSKVHTVFTDPYFPRLTEGIVRACNQANYTLALFLFTSPEDELKVYPRITTQGFLDGVVIQSTQFDDETLTWFKNGNIPFVFVGRPAKASDVNFVDVDNVNGAYKAVRHLLQLGYRKIGTVTGPLNTSVGLDRLYGYKNALNEKGILAREELICVGDFTEIGGYYAALKLIPEAPDAVFVASDMMALGVLRAFREAGYSIPGDIGIVGYDDLPPATLAIPTLTTVRQPISQLGENAVEILLEMIENPGLPIHQAVFDTELVVRESCGHTRMLKR